MATAQENTALITAKITGVTTRSKKLNNEIQEILNDISGHVLDHGDVTLYTKLYKDLKGVDKYALAKWIQMYGLATFKTDGSFSLWPGSAPGKVRFLYNTSVDTGRNIPNWIEEELTESSLKRFIVYVKKNSER